MEKPLKQQKLVPIGGSKPALIVTLMKVIKVGEQSNFLRQGDADFKGT